MISPERRSWHCFGGCNEGGDVISFVMKYENIEFYDALKLLADRAGIDPARLRGGGEYRRYDALYAAVNAAKEFFKENMSQEVREYALGRGLKQETIGEFELGEAPAAQDVLLRHLVKAGFSVNDLEGAGLVFKTARGTYWDRFRGRLMFPIYNHVGKAVGFTGRMLSIADAPADPPAHDAGAPKYTNSPETPIFNKSKVLYGFHAAKGNIREAGAAVLVEGQMDFLMSYQSGVKNAVATSGTALTDEHLIALRRLGDRLLLAFDSDEAGQRAIERGMDMALAHDFSVGIVALPGKDPADVAREDAELLVQLVATPLPAREFYFKRYLPPRGAPMDGELLKRGVQAVLVKAKGLASPVEQAIWLKELGARTGFPEHVLSAEMARIEKTSAEKPHAAPSISAATASALGASRKERIITRILELGGKAELATHAPEYAEFSDTADAELHAAWRAGDVSDGERTAEVKLLVSELKKEMKRERLVAARAAIVAAQALGDEARLASAMRDFDNISRELHTTDDGTA